MDDESQMTKKDADHAAGFDCGTLASRTPFACAVWGAASASEILPLTSQIAASASEILPLASQILASASENAASASKKLMRARQKLRLARLHCLGIVCQREARASERGEQIVSSGAHVDRRGTHVDRTGTQAEEKKAPLLGLGE